MGNLAHQRSAIIAILSTALTLAVSAPSHAAGTNADVPEGNVTVEVLAVNGSGCAPGTATVTAAPDKSGFRIKYSDFVAEAGGGADPTARRKNCQVGVLVNIPAGWTFAIAEANYRGRARLQAGSTGLQRTNYYWQGSSEGSRTEETFTGPLFSYWRTDDVAPTLFYVPCAKQQVLNVNTELRVNPGTSSGRSSLSMNSSEGDVDTLFNFTWERC